MAKAAKKIKAPTLVETNPEEVNPADAPAPATTDDIAAAPAADQEAVAPEVMPAADTPAVEPEPSQAEVELEIQPESPASAPEVPSIARQLADHFGASIVLEEEGAVTLQRGGTRVCVNTREGFDHARNALMNWFPV